MKKTKGDRMFKGCYPFIQQLVGKQRADEVMNHVYQRYDALVEENKEEPSVMDPHTKARIYPAIAIFESLLQEECTREEAAQVIYDFFDIFAAKGARFIQIMLKIPGLYKKVPNFAVKMIDQSFGKDAGFQSIDHHEKNGMHIDMIVCPYHQICKKYHCPEIVKAFCHSDDVAYGHMHPKLEWARTKTLGRGDDCCDFILRIKK